MEIGNKFVKFLNSYVTANPKHEAAFDEFIQHAQRLVDEPLRVASPIEAQLITWLSGDSPVSVILTGNAGDGKTYLCRRTIEAIAGRPFRGWDEDGRVPISNNGKRLRVVKDLSELSDEAGLEIMRQLERSLNQSGGDYVWLIAANEGKLRHLLEKGKFGALEQFVDDLFEERSHATAKQLVLVDLNHSRTSNYVGKVLSYFTAGHRWSACASCPAQFACPILFNRRQLATDIPSGRLHELYSLLEHLGTHITFRDMLIQLAYVITGGLSCDEVINSQPKTTDWHLYAYYHNTWSESALHMAVGTHLRKLDVGTHTRFDSDDYIINGPGPHASDTERAANQALFRPDVDLNHLRFAQDRDEYLRSGSEPTQLNSAPPFIAEWLVHCRRKLFFEIDSDERALSMIPFRHLGQYLALFGAIKPVGLQDVKLALIRGLNRAFTGLYVNETTLFVTSQYSHAVEQPIPIVRLHRPEADISLRAGKETPEAFAGIDLPKLVVRHPESGTVGAVSWPIDLLMFEYLMRLSQGGTPNVLAEDCQLRVRRFKDELLAKFGQSSEDDGSIQFFAPSNNRYVIRHLHVDETKGISA